MTMTPSVVFSSSLSFFVDLSFVCLMSSVGRIILYSRQNIILIIGGENEDSDVSFANINRVHYTNIHFIVV